MMALRDLLYTNGRKAQFELRRILGVKRQMPHFIVIGAQKSGTSSMFSYLKQHKRIVRPVFKEIYYFDRHYSRGLDWYGANFPSQAQIARMNDRTGAGHLTFEGTATYIFDPHAPERIARDIETRKFIALLRDPVDRAISAYWHARRMGLETRTLDEAIQTDRERYEHEAIFENGGPPPRGSAPQRRFLRRGIYRESIERWMRSFAPENLLILQSEVMFADPAATMARVFAFLDLPVPAGINYAPQNVGSYDGSDAAARAMLKEFYRPHNLELNRRFGLAMTW